MYGTQADGVVFYLVWRFENDVKMYGTQATLLHQILPYRFENDVKMYGTQAIEIRFRFG